MITNSLESDHEVIYSPRADGEPPYISIMIPTYNRIETLCKAIHSALTQKSYVSFEVVIVDNCSEDKVFNQTRKLIHEINDPRVGLIRNAENIGMFRNWNQCIALAKGEYVTILNDDDMLSSLWLGSVVSKHCGSRMVLVKNKRFRHGFDNLNLALGSFSTTGSIREVSLVNLIQGNPVSGSLGCLVRRSAAMDCGGYDPSLYPTSDYYFNARYLARHGGILLEDTLALYGVGLNESFRHDVLVGFALNDFLLRLEILGWFSPVKPGAINSLVRFVSLMHSAVQIHFYRTSFPPFTCGSNEFADVFSRYGFSHSILIIFHRVALLMGGRLFLVNIFWLIYVKTFLPGARLGVGPL